MISAGGRPLGVVLHGEVAGHHALVGAVAGQRRHHQPVRQLPVAYA